MDRWRTRFWILLTIVLVGPILLGIYAAVRFLPDRPVTYSNIEDHFKYGSTGGEREAGFPYWIWKAMPVVFADKLPQNGGKGYEAFGMVYENDEHGRRRDRPVGWMMRRNLGIDRVFVNCAICHHTTVRLRADQPPRVYVGTGATNVDLGAFEEFLFACVADERFNAQNIIPEVERQAGPLSLIDRLVVYRLAIWLMRERVAMLRNRFNEFDPPSWGPGRVDTWNSAKAGLNFDLPRIRRDHPVELHGAADFPSIWNQRKREHRDDGRPMELHWTGNNDHVNERNLSAAFGTGATPSTVDHAAIGRLQDWLLDAKPAPFPFPIDKAAADRGAVVYKQYCADCHGVSGQDFRGKYVGHVTPIDAIGTDRHHYDSYTADLAVNQSTLYAGTKYRFTHFRKTAGYANAPLDGIWLRGPYLHNGSVPTLRDLLNPSCDGGAECRPKTFYRGYDLLNPVKVGFVSVPQAGGRRFHLYDTSLPTQGNRGHEGETYGTTLPPADKNAIVEYLKTF